MFIILDLFIFIFYFIFIYIYLIFFTCYIYFISRILKLSDSSSVLNCNMFE